MLRLLALLLLCVPAAASAEPLAIPPLNGSPVVDAANIIPPDAEARLISRLLEIDKKSPYQVAVLTTPTLHGYTIEDYSLAAARHYALGSEHGDGGILITVAPTERKTRIETGYGAEDIVTDIEANRIIQLEMLPYFKAGKFGNGIEAGVEAIAVKVVPPSPVQLAMLQREKDARRQAEARAWADFKDALGTVFFVGLGLLTLWGLYMVATAPARRRRREQEEQEERRRVAAQLEEWRAERAERQKRERAAELQRLAAARAERARRAALTPAQRAAEDRERRRQRDAAAKASEEAARKRRRSSYSSSSGYSSGYSSSSSSGGFGGGGFGGGGGFSGGGGSFGGGGSSGSW